MRNNYQQMMENIHTPAELNDRVLRAAGDRTWDASVKTHTPGKRRTVLRTAVCAACALALVVGSVQLRPAQNPDAGDGAAHQDGGAVTLAPTFSFGLTAYAAGPDESYLPAPNSGIAFWSGEGCVTLDGGNYTGLLFRITGEEIETVSLSIDRGGLYRYRLHEDLTGEQMAEIGRASCRERV